jgi:hypothetical protein
MLLLMIAAVLSRLNGAVRHRQKHLGRNVDLYI